MGKDIVQELVHELVVLEQTAESNPESKRVGGIHDVDLSHGELPIQTVLGVRWSVSKVSLEEKSAARQENHFHCSLHFQHPGLSSSLSAAWKENTTEERHEMGWTTAKRISATMG